jgi:HEAT repeat protein
LNFLGLSKPDVEKMEENKDVEGLIKALEHRDRRVRGLAVLALGRIGDSRAAGPVIGLLKDDDYHVRWAAAWAVATLADIEAMDPLTQALGDENETVRVQAARGFGIMATRGLIIGDSKAIEVLTSALRDKSPHVRKAVEEALEKVRPPPPP